jgi:hypothetical protein
LSSNINFGFSATPSFCGLDPTKKTDITYMLSVAIMVELAFLHQNVDSDSVTNVDFALNTHSLTKILQQCFVTTKQQHLSSNIV